MLPGAANLARVVAKKLGWAEDDLEVNEVRNSPGPGNVLLLEALYEKVTEVVTGFGQRTVSAEKVAIIRESGIRLGAAHVFNVGSTGAIGTIEFEPGLEGDLPEMLDRLIPPDRNLGHERTWHDGNGHSHLQATLLGPELTIPVRDGQPVLGTWQQVFHLDCDVRPHRRRVVVTVMGD